MIDPALFCGTLRTIPRRLAGRRLRLLRIALLTLPLLAVWATGDRLAAQEPPGAVIVEVHAEGEPVEGAEVEGVGADGAGVRGLTDAAGRVRLVLPPGRARLEVRRVGFGEAEVALEVAAGQNVTVEVDLGHDALEIEGVEVTSTRTGRRVQDVPLRVEVLDQEEIEEKMLMTPGNIAMLLNETGGLRVQVTSPSLGAANIRVQGMRGRYTQLLADGLPLYGGQAGAIGLLQIPPADLGQVEVIKGVASALYGASALGGVVNLISRRPEEEHAAELLLNATTQDGQDVTAYGSGPLSGSWGYSVLGAAHRQGLQDLDGTGWADVPEHRRASVRPRLFWQGGDGRSALITLGAMTEERRGGTLPGRTLPDGGAFVESLDTERLDAGISVQHPLGGMAFLQLRASGMVQDHRHAFGELQEEDRHGTFFGEAALRAGDGRYTWVLGAALQRDAYRSDTFPAFDYTFTVPGIFGQVDVQPRTSFVASLSARWDRHSAYGSQLSPRLSALYRPGPWTFRASVGGGFFAPTPFTEEIEAAGLARLEPVEGLRAERATTVSLDAGRTVGPLELNATLFGSVVTNAVRLLPLEEGEVEGVRLANVEGETRTAGTELLARYRIGDVSITGSYVFARATEVDPLADARRDVPLTPEHTAGLVLMWEDHERGLLGIETYYTGWQALEDNPYRARGRPYVHVGILGELRRGPVSVFLNAENLLDVRQTEYDPLVRRTRAPDGRWTVDAWAPLEGATLNGGVRIRLGGHDD